MQEAWGQKLRLKLLVPAMEKTLELEHEESYGQNKILSIPGPALAVDLECTDWGKKNEQRRTGSL